MCKKNKWLNFGGDQGGFRWINEQAIAALYPPLQLQYVLFEVQKLWG